MGAASSAAPTTLGPARRQLLHGHAELRYDFTPLPDLQITQVQFYGFVDGGNVFDRVSFRLCAKYSRGIRGGGLRLAWLAYANADFTVAKAIDGPRDDTRLFFSLTAKY